MWLGVEPKGKNKTPTPTSFGPFCQLLTSLELPLITFNTTITYNCTLGVINKLYPKYLLYIQPLHLIFIVIQSHEC